MRSGKFLGPQQQVLNRQNGDEILHHVWEDGTNWNTQEVDSPKTTELVIDGASSRRFSSISQRVPR
jgi:hypothetical protein